MKKFLICLFFLIISSQVYAELPIYGAIGLGGYDKFKSNLKDPSYSNKDYFSSYGGFTAELQADYPLILNTFIFGGVDFATGSGKGQYHYQNLNTGSSSNKEDIKFSLTRFSARAGLKLRLFGNSPINPTIGGGMLGGIAAISYENTDGLPSSDVDKNSDGASFYGPFAQAGLELTGSEWGIRFQVRREFIKMGKLVTLNSEKLNFEVDSAGIYYIEKY